MRYVLSTIVLAAMAMPFTAGAQQQNAYAQIVSGDYGRAEQTILAERRIFPDRPELMLNLAAIYQRTDRATEARALYVEVLARPDELMDLSADRTAWSHSMAAGALRRLEGVQISAR